VVADPPGAVTPRVPVVADVGTVATSCVDVDEVIVAATPWKVSVF